MGRVEVDFAAARKVVDDAADFVLIAAAWRVVEVAQELAPVGETGHLRRSIEVGVKAARWIWVVATAAYSIYVERGTGIYAAEGGGRDTPWTYRAANGQFYTTEGMRPQPFLNPALDIVANEGLRR